MEALINPTTLADQAYTTLLDAICDGTLKPGERLTQAVVADRLKVSRQPVHNALLVLKSQGFVRSAGRRGLAVAPVDQGFFHSLFEFRAAVEPLAVRLACARVKTKDIARARTLLADGKAATRRRDIRSMIEADMNFHIFLYELSGNMLIVDAMRLNWQHLRRAMGTVLQQRVVSTRVWKEHTAIVNALLARNADVAASQMEAHIVRAHSDVTHALETSAPPMRGIEIR